VCVFVCICVCLYEGKIEREIEKERAWHPTRNHPWEEQACATRRLRDARKRDMEHCVDISSGCPSRSWQRTEQVRPLLWQHYVRPCAARYCIFQMARGARTSSCSSSQARGARANGCERHVQDRVAWCCQHGRWCRQHGANQLIVHSQLCNAPRTVGMSHHTLHLVSCACHYLSECATIRHTCCSCAGHCKNEYRDVYAQRGVSMGVLVNAHSCGVGVHRAASAGAWRHRTP